MLSKIVGWLIDLILKYEIFLNCFLCMMSWFESKEHKFLFIHFILNFVIIFKRIPLSKIKDSSKIYCIHDEFRTSHNQKALNDQFFCSLGFLESIIMLILIFF